MLFAGSCALVGLPTDPAYAFVWLWAAAIAWNSHLPKRAHGSARRWRNTAAGAGHSEM